MVVVVVVVTNICIKRSYLGLARSLCSVSYCIITIFGLFVQDSVEVM